METCCSAGAVSNLWNVAIRPKDLLFLVFRGLAKLVGLPPSLLKTFSKDGRHVHPPPPLMALETVVGTLLDLPQDVLMVIFAKLDIPDLVRAGSVCSSWRAAYKSLLDFGEYKKSQTPYLLYTSESAGDNVACLYSLVEQREYRLTLPDPPFRSRFVIGSSNGWLVTADERSEMHLVNPITGEQIALPPVATIEHVKPIFDDSGTVQLYELSGHHIRWEPEIYALKDLREDLYVKAFVFPNLSTRSYIVVLIHNPKRQLSFARAGDDKWTLLPHDIYYKDCMCMDGLLYALTSHGEVYAFDLTASTITVKVIVDRVKNDCESMYLIPAPWGDLLQVWRVVGHPTPRHRIPNRLGIFYHPEHEVWRIVNHPEHEEEDVDALGILDHPEQEDENVDALEPTMHMIYMTNDILVYKLDMAAKELVRINSLPHHALFLGHNQSLCLDAAEHPQLKANHAYFTDDFFELATGLKNHTRDIGFFNLETGRRKKIVSQIWSNWPCPTWMIPNLTKMGLAFRK